MSEQISMPGTATRRAPPPLTRRDVEVLRCLEARSSTAEIAAALDISVNTVRTRIRRVEVKLGALCREGAVQAARDLGLLGSAAAG